MGLFGKSFEEKVQLAVERVRGQFPNAQIDARVDQGDSVTLTGHAADLDTKTQIMAAFNAAVETKNTLNQITIAQATTPQAAGTSFSSPPLGMTAASEQRMHDVASGDTLSALAKRYYGDASQYNRIFEANRDQLSDPDKIQVGQKLKIPR